MRCPLGLERFIEDMRCHVAMNTIIDDNNLNVSMVEVRHSSGGNIWSAEAEQYVICNYRTYACMRSYR